MKKGKKSIGISAGILIFLYNLLTPKRYNKIENYVTFGHTVISFIKKLTADENLKQYYTKN